MGRFDTPDIDITGQLSMENYDVAASGLFAMSRIFARARRDMSLSEQKAFVCALTKLRFTDGAKNNIVRIDKKELAKAVGINSDPNHLSVDLNRAIGDMAKHSYIKISDHDRGVYDNGAVISRVTILKNMVRIKFEEEYLSMFTGLSKDYITLWSYDIYGMNSTRSIQFYEYLRRITELRKPENDVIVGVRTMKEMFGIPMRGKGSYMREKGGFDRTRFEQKVIDPICEDLKHCKMINLIVQPDGKYYEKVKNGNKVAGYKFFWTYTARPGIASAQEVAAIQDRVDQDPQVLKVARDIVRGEKKRRKAPQSGNAFNQFEHNQYDFDELEKDLLSNYIPEE